MNNLEIPGTLRAEVIECETGTWGLCFVPYDDSELFISEEKLREAIALVNSAKNPGTRPAYLGPYRRNCGVWKP